MAVEIVHVAVAAIVNNKNQVLIAKRPNHVHQGGLWEFPGGKLEDNETVDQALVREIKEELNISVQESELLIKINHFYKDKSVLLDVQLVKKYTGNPVGAEGQLVKWEKISALREADFPKANKNIIAALKLPDLYMITGEFESKKIFRKKLRSSLKKGEKIVQLRCKHIKNSKNYIDLAEIAKSICDEFNVILLLNTTVENFNKSRASGLHLNSRSIFQYKSRPISNDKILSVSCHNEEEIKQAELLNADIVLLSPVKETLSHPDVKGMGWVNFKDIKNSVSFPVYALGGMKQEDLSKAKESGAQGIASISMLWSDE